MASPLPPDVAATHDGRAARCRTGDVAWRPAPRLGSTVTLRLRLRSPSPDMRPPSPDPPGRNRGSCPYRRPRSGDTGSPLGVTAPVDARRENAVGAVSPVPPVPLAADARAWRNRPVGAARAPATPVAPDPDPSPPSHDPSLLDADASSSSPTNGVPAEARRMLHARRRAPVCAAPWHGRQASLIAVPTSTSWPCNTATRLATEQVHRHAGTHTLCSRVCCRALALQSHPAATSGNNFRDLFGCAPERNQSRCQQVGSAGRRLSVLRAVGYSDGASSPLSIAA